MSTDDPTKTIAFVLYPGLTPLDLVGPLQVVTTLQVLGELQRRHSGAEGPAAAFRAAVVAERLDPLPSDTPLHLAADHTFEQLPDPFAIVVPGGGGPTLAAMGNPTIVDYVRSAADGAEIVASVCTGALILATAGLLDGRSATTHWGYHRILEALGARYVPQRWVEDDRFITAAGVSAGIDMALRLVARLTDEQTARMVQLGIEYDPQPPYGGIDWTRVDRDMYAPQLAQLLRSELPERPELVEAVTGAPTR